MKARLEALKRIERLQRRLHDLSVWKLASLERRRDELAQAHVEMLTATSEGLLAYGGPAATANRRLRTIEVELVAAEVGRRAQAKRALDQGARAKLADFALESLAAEHRAHVEKNTLADIIEASLRSPSPASRKA